MDEKYVCPQCHSDDVRKIEMIWKEQTGDIDLDSVGTTFGTGGVNVGYFKSHGPQLSKLAREAARREKEIPILTFWEESSWDLFWEQSLESPVSF